jgi:cellulose synthase/poly-beta-1,6-N-acetylglucosamine synthase-like glycosyltransferase
MITFIGILAICAILYTIIALLIHLGLERKYKRTTINPTVSILVPARNEEKLLPGCLSHLEKLNYPRERLNIYILNDRSSDKTHEIALSYSRRLPHFHLIDIEDDVLGLEGKMNALSQGIDNSEGDIIFVTDADCRVSVNWVDQMCSYFTKNIAMVGGLTIIADENNDKTSRFKQIQTLDWFFLQAIASGSAGLGLAVSILGNNFAFRRSVYEKIGGFKSIGFSLTEDFALLKKMTESSENRIAYDLHSDNSVISTSLDNFSEFYEQRKRWLRGGINVNLWGWFMMLVSFLTHVFVFLGFFYFPESYMYLIIFLTVVILDGSLIRRVARRVNIKINPFNIFIYEIFYTGYTIVLALSLIIKSPVRWKNRTYDIS